MIVAERVWLTREGWEELTDELHRCKGLLDSRLSGYMDAIRGSEPGDAAVRHEQQEIQAVRTRMAFLENLLSRASPVDAADRMPGVVGVGSSITVQWEDGEEESYLIVGPPEVDLPTNRISYASPVGKSLIGRRQGEWIEASTPAGTSRMKIMAVH